MRAPGPEQQLKEQLARELCAIFHGYQRDVAAVHLDAHPTEISRLRRGRIRRFSLARIVRYVARAGYDIEVHLKRTPRFEDRPAPRRPTGSVRRYDYFGQIVGKTEP